MDPQDHHRNHDRSLRIAHIQEVEVQDPAVMVETGGRMPSAVGCLAWGGPVDNLGQVDIVRSNTTGTLLYERVYVGIQDQACRSLVCSQDIRRDVLLDGHKDTRPLQNSIRILRTTNTLAYA